MLGHATLSAATRTLTISNPSKGMTVGTTKVVAPDISISNSDAALKISTVSVQIVAGFLPGDLLYLTETLPAGFESNWNATTGILLIYQTTPVANNFDAFSSVCRLVGFIPTQSIRQNTARTIQFTPLESGKSYAHPDGTWHFYDFIATTQSWTSASSAAPSNLYYGQVGYLATVTSTEEDAFIHSQASSSAGWVAGSSAAAHNLWKWQTGPETGTLFYTVTSVSSGVGNGTSSGYTNWNTSEPNGYSTTTATTEPYTQLLANGKWNNLADATLLGYFVEWGGTTGANNAVTINVVNSNSIKHGFGF